MKLEPRNPNMNRHLGGRRAETEVFVPKPYVPPIPVMLDIIEQRRVNAIRNIFARVPPTREDQVIIKRNFERMLRWAQPLDVRAQMFVLRRWCDDYTHDRFDTVLFTPIN